MANSELEMSELVRFYCVFNDVLFSSLIKSASVLSTVVKRKWGSADITISVVPGFSGTASTFLLFRMMLAIGLTNTTFITLMLS